MFVSDGPSMASGIGVPDSCPGGSVLLSNCNVDSYCYFPYSRNRIVLVDGSYHPEVRDSNGMESSCQYIHYLDFIFESNTWSYYCGSPNARCYLLANCDLGGTEICYGSCKYLMG